MLRRVWMLLALGLVAGCGSTPAPRVTFGDGAGTLQIVVNGVRHTEGQMALSVYASGAGFPSEADSALTRLYRPISGDTVEFLVEDLPFGLYAVAVLHDENGNGAMETDFLGRPAEGYGFTRDARGSWGPPKFENAVVRFTAEETRHEVALEYP